MGGDSFRAAAHSIVPERPLPVKPCTEAAKPPAKGMSGGAHHDLWETGLRPGRARDLWRRIILRPHRGPLLIVAAGLQPRGKGHHNSMKRQEIRDGLSDGREFLRSPKGLRYEKRGRPRRSQAGSWLDDIFHPCGVASLAMTVRWGHKSFWVLSKKEVKPWKVRLLACWV
jgi:hypothetical protein